MVPREIDATAFEDRPFRFYVRDIAAISPRDLQQLSVESVDAVSIEGQSGGVRPARQSASGQVLLASGSVPAGALGYTAGDLVGRLLRRRSTPATVAR